MREALIHEFADIYPSLYHMAESGSWTSIQRHGLLSTAALLDLFEISGSQRVALESQWRRKSETIGHPCYGEAVVRDQRPMPPDALRSVLIDTTATEWYELLNRKVFLWVDECRLKKMLESKSYRDVAHDVVKIDTKALLNEYFDWVTVCRLNSGSVRGRQGPRSPASFQTISDRKATYGLRGLAELTVDHAVRDVERYVISVDSWKGATRRQQVWSP